MIRELLEDPLLSGEPNRAQMVSLFLTTLYQWPERVISYIDLLPADDKAQRSETLTIAFLGMANRGRLADALDMAEIAFEGKEKDETLSGVFGDFLSEGKLLKAIEVFDRISPEYQELGRLAKGA